MARGPSDWASQRLQVVGQLEVAGIAEQVIAENSMTRGCRDWVGQILKYVSWLEAEKLSVTGSCSMWAGQRLQYVGWPEVAVCRMARGCSIWAGQRLQYVGWPEVAVSGLKPNLLHPPSSGDPSGSIPPREGGRINKHWPRAELFVLLDLSVLLT